MHKKTKLILTLLLIAQIIGLRILSYFPEFVEKQYSQGLFPFLSKMSRTLFGWVPFSVGDVLYSALFILIIRWLYYNIKRIRKSPISFFLDITAALSIVYFVFNVFWGFNYYRIPLHQTLNLERDYTTEQLITLTNRLIEKSNALHRELGYADSIKVELPYSQKEIFALSTNGYKNLSEDYPTFKYQPSSIKKSGWSLGLTYMGYSGYYNPFTAEAQVNNLIKNSRFPVVTCHEEAHQLGYAAENEANFLAYLASTNNDNLYFQYSGYIFALRYCVNEIARRDMDTYDEIIKTVNFGILESYRETREFWESYENPFEVVSKIFFDSFLKANNQEKGIDSYSYMVALLVNYSDGKSF
ncbi:MAG: DUF3810 domain-containing protein [Flavobacteriaceae bacterium CG_4_8_14_3_um_filter_34_10]|nr:DUF3810 domain-containing protein [Flavobacteriia bacterium]OIP50445.1 MAG: amino acid permease [Flavobacteriaceae bacterium CG2_30_34_30]PIQ18244.1 MAG: amino acid permease [Flavobacteriaceae bacterium CG18_big_fil_WC_8_21_14_2_50_34_36]PIV50194.1 MAG: DUF3810 domain-containing protein [Flavobacteriaceae bacterium CG02_land_8_20_14_3_00_34_13]PIX10689.1 MAG: DUF3810 domain-containing protein [Flavobacteriaceae bacterium CG_4_8_14_3_um_filter_34_10]PIZ09046.1 MAG: DUF3810 domain-containing 